MCWSMLHHLEHSGFGIYCHQLFWDLQLHSSHFDKLRSHYALLQFRTQRHPTPACVVGLADSPQTCSSAVLLWNAGQHKWPTHTPGGEWERPEDFQKTFWGKLGCTYKIRPWVNEALLRAEAQGKNRKKRSKLRCTFWPHLESSFLMHQNILILQGTPKTTFLKNFPFFCSRSSFHVSLSVPLQWAVRGDEGAALHLFLFLRDTFGISEWWQWKYMGKKSDLLAPKHEFSGKLWWKVMRNTCSHDHIRQYWLSWTSHQRKSCPGMQAALPEALFLSGIQFFNPRNNRFLSKLKIPDKNVTF